VVPRYPVRLRPLGDATGASSPEQEYKYSKNRYRLCSSLAEYEGVNDAERLSLDRQSAEGAGMKKRVAMSRTGERGVQQCRSRVQKGNAG
jgi:hypothetical protein